MIWTTIFMSLMAMDTLEQYLPSTDTYLLGLANHLPVLNTVNLFDGPGSISHALTANTTTTKPSLEQMMYYNYYAASMYCSDQLTDLSCLYCQNFKNDVDVHKVLNNNDQDTLALITVSNSREEIVVTYRGTMNVWNAILDTMLINVSPSNASLIKIHKGFYIATMSLYNDVVEAVERQRILHSTYKIVIAGHSLGGAMARITEFFFLYLNQFPEATYEVYTFGELRVGNKYFVDFLNTQDLTTARVVDRADIFPHIIPTSIAGSTILFDYYIHVQTEYWINGEDGSTFCNQSFYEDPACSDSLGPLYTPVDHITYFDADYFTCFVNQPLPLFALPFNLPQLVTALPPLPTFISNFLGGLSNIIVNIISPILGR